MPPTVTGILETGLYVEDVERSREFYQRVFGFPVVTQDSQRLVVLKVGDRQVLLLFKKGGTPAPLTLPGGTLPAHDGDGQLHFAFSIPAGSLAEWEARFEECAVPITGRVDWSGGSQSVYFSDPDGHVGELVTPGLWGIG